MGGRSSRRARSPGVQHARRGAPRGAPRGAAAGDGSRTRCVAVQHDSPRLWVLILAYTSSASAAEQRHPFATKSEAFCGCTNCVIFFLSILFRLTAFFFQATNKPFIFLLLVSFFHVKRHRESQLARVRLTSTLLQRRLFNTFLLGLPRGVYL